MKVSRVSKFLPPKWWSRLSKSELEQEELIQEWKHPDNADVRGLLAYYRLLMDAYEEGVLKHKELIAAKLGDTTELQEIDKYLLDPYHAFVLESLEGKSQVEVSKELNVSPERVSKIVSEIRDQLTERESPDL